MVPVTAALSEIYERFLVSSPEMTAAAVLMAILALLPGVILIKNKENTEVEV